MGVYEVPDSLVRAICQLVVREEAPGNRLLYLTSLLGVCQHWRLSGLCNEVLLPLSFDGADTGGAPSKQATLAKFRKCDVARKRATFLGASRHLTGEHQLAGRCQMPSTATYRTLLSSPAPLQHGGLCSSCVFGQVCRVRAGPAPGAVSSYSYR